jgi:hypothetical protein
MYLEVIQKHNLVAQAFLQIKGDFTHQVLGLD